MNKELAASLNLLVKVMILCIFVGAWCMAVQDQNERVALHKAQDAIAQEQMVKQVAADSKAAKDKALKGKTCTDSKKPFLTDNVLVTRDEGVTYEWFTFKEALAHDSTTFIVAYCN